MEQMRIVKQMREASKQKLISEFGEDYDKTKVSPRYMVWENVCTIFDTLVETSNGLKKIGEIQSGELVRTHDGTYHKVVLTHKTEMQPTIKVKYQGGELVCTPNHPILAEDMTYKPACEFKVGDRVAFKVDEPGTKSIGMPIAYAFGRWLADGSVAIRNDRRTKHRIFISTGYKKYEDLKSELSKLPYRINEHKMDWAINFTFSSDEFGELTDSAGYGARNKQVPEWVFELIAEEQAEVLRGYLAGDGYQRTRSENHSECIFTTSSEKLAYGIARLVRAVYHVGVSLSYREGKGTTIIDGREVAAHDSWQCSFSIPSKYEHNIQGIAGASKFENGYVWCKIKEVSEGEVQDVYNLSVEDNNTFTANGIICHNCGAYSSGTPEGADFQAVLEEIARVVLNEVPTIPIPTDGWPYAGNLEGVGEESTPFSICWRTHDAQYWGKTVIDNCGRVVKAGTPQRRRRIALVADFGGSTAPEILFEREGLSGNTEQSRETRQGTPRATRESVEKPGTIGFHLTQDPVSSVEKSYAVSCGSSMHGQCVNGVLTCEDVISDPVQKTYKKDAHAKTSEDGQGWVETDINDTLNAFDSGETRTPTLVVNDSAAEPILLESNQNHATVQTDGVSTTLPASMGEGGGYVPMVVNSAESSSSEVCYGFEPGVAQRVDPENRFSEEISPTLRAKMGDNQASVVYGVCSYDSNAMKSDNPHSGIYEADTSRTLDLNGGNPGCNQGGMIVLEGNGSRPSHKGDGYSESETMYTLNATEQHAVCIEEPVAIESHPQDSRVKINSEDINQTISSNMAHDASNGGLVLQKTVAPIKESTKSYGVTTKGNGDAFISEERHTSLSTGGGEPGQGYPCVLTEQAAPVGCLNPWEHQGKHIQSENGVAETLYAGESRYGGGESYVMQTQTYQDVTVFTDTGFQDICQDDVAFTLRARDYKSPQTVAIDMDGGKSGCGISEEKAPTLTTTHGGEPAVYGFKPDQGSKAHGMGFEEEKSPTLSTCNNAGVLSIENHPNDSRIKVRADGTVQTLSSRMGTGGNNTPMVMEKKENFYAATRDTILCLLSQTYGEKEIIQWGVNVLASLQQAEILQQGVHESGISGKTQERYELDDCSLPRPELVAYWLLRDMRERKECGCSSQGWKSPEQLNRESSEIMQKLSQQSSQTCKNLFVMWSQGEGVWLLRETLSKIQEIRKSSNGQRQPIYTCAVVRRLTPEECTLLQGFPRGWCDIGDWVDTKGKVHKDSDSAKYKALGNSIALPFWDWMAGRMCDQLRQSGVEHPTMASLFSGIGGFEFVYKLHGCEPIWSSEIEEFPIAVTKKHFGDDETGTIGDFDQYVNSSTPTWVQDTNTCLALDRASFNQGQNAKYDFSVESELAQTLISRGPGGGNDTIGALCSSDYKGIRNQDIDQAKYVIEFRDENN